MAKHTKVIFGLLLSCLALAFTGTASAQIPVTDASSLAQQILQVKSWAKQLTAMADQIKQAKAQHDALTGNRGFGAVLNDPELQTYLQGIETPNSQALRQQYGTANCSAYASAAIQQNCRAVADQPYKDYNQLNQAMNVATKKQEQIQSLIQQIDETDDPKAIAELQARIAGEQANMQNEYVKMQLALQQMQIQNQLVKDQQSRAVSEQTRAELERAYKAKIKY